MTTIRHRRALALVLIPILLLCMVGCGGGGGAPANGGGGDDGGGGGQTTGTVTGTVTSGGQPLSGVVVTIGTRNDTTGTDGRYTLSGVSAGNVTITASKSGYHSYSSTLSVSGGSTRTHNISMTLSAVPITHTQGTTGSDGRATFSAPGGGSVQVKVADSNDGSALPGIKVFFVTDGTDGAYFCVDPSGRYAPRIAPMGETGPASAPSRGDVGTALWYTFTEIWLTLVDRVSGYQPIAADRVESRLMQEIISEYYTYARSCRLEGLALSVVDLAVGIGVDILIIAVAAVPTLEGSVAGIAWTAVEVLDQVAIDQWHSQYVGLGYSSDQNFEIYRLDTAVSLDNPSFLILPTEEPRRPPSGRGTIAGRITNGRTGQGISGADVRIFPTGLGLRDSSNSNGDYSISNVPAGTYWVTATKYGFYQNSAESVGVRDGERTTANVSLSPLLESQEWRIILTWGEDPRDLDSHLWTPSIQGSSYHIFFPSASRGSLTEPPYANLDVDDTSSYGPETVTIASVFPGTYHYAVHKYAGSGYLTSSSAVVEVYDSVGLVRRFTVPTAGSGSWWHVFRFDGNTQAITPVNTISDVAPQSFSTLSAPAKVSSK